jgi:hypothetical protein
MQNANTIRGIYGKRGSEGLPLERVYRHLFDPELFLEAYGKIYRNAGAMTPGSTEETVDGMSLQKIHGIIDLLKQERYQWTPVRRAEIPKANGKTRPLGIPTWGDKLVQEALRSLLEPYYEQRFSNSSHGFRPNRGHMRPSVKSGGGRGRRGSSRVTSRGRSTMWITPHCWTSSGVTSKMAGSSG